MVRKKKVRMGKGRSVVMAVTTDTGRGVSLERYGTADAIMLL